MTREFLKNVISTVVFFSASVAIGIVLGYWFDSGSDRIKTVTEYKDREVVKEVEISRRDESTRACVKNGGVPTYSAWDGTLNGCIYVGQSHRDTNVEVKP